jgi:hypothetical protein
LSIAWIGPHESESRAVCRTERVCDLMATVYSGPLQAPEATGW